MSKILALVHNGEGIIVILNEDDIIRYLVVVVVDDVLLLALVVVVAVHVKLFGYHQCTRSKINF